MTYPPTEKWPVGVLMFHDSFVDAAWARDKYQALRFFLLRVERRLFWRRGQFLWVGSAHG
jgi:hypothetical protein